MKILILNGSPRADGNTVSMVNAFADGAKETGNEVQIIQVGRKKIADCLGCEYCHSKGNGKCIQIDDMEEVYDALKVVDMLVLASPVYYFSLSGHLHNAIDRTYAFDIPTNIKKAALIMSSGSAGVYNAAIQQYQSIIGYFNIEDKGIKTAYGMENKSKAVLDDLRMFGSSL